ncbi:MAG: hypothetical protein EA378_06890 [Phycisphaerales bacterium]|nr:MAG: hypothetical protein EA378_06890 [Phycisphaerales bacterium]
MDRPGGDNTPRPDPRRGPHPADADPRVPDAARIPDDLVDAFFDRELDREAQRRMFDRLRGDPPRCEEITSTREMLRELRRKPDAPDLTGAILARVESRRAFLTPTWRKLVTTGRLAVAAGVLLGIGLAATAQRLWPEATTFRDQPAPLTGFVDSTRADASSSFRALERTLGAAPRQIAGRLGDEFAPVPLVASTHAEAVPSDRVLGDRARPDAIDMAAATRYFACSSSLWPSAACDFRTIERHTPTHQPDPAINARAAAARWGAPAERDLLRLRMPDRSRLLHGHEPGMSGSGDRPFAAFAGWPDRAPRLDAELFHTDPPHEPDAFRAQLADRSAWLAEARSATFEPRAILRGSTGVRVLELHVPEHVTPGQPRIVTRWTPAAAVGARAAHDRPTPPPSHPADDLP